MIKYKDYNIKQDFTIKRIKFYSVVGLKVLWGGSIEIVKKKIDKEYLK